MRKYIPLKPPVRGFRHTAACIACGLLGAVLAIAGIALVTDKLF